VAERAPDTAAILAECPEDVQVRLGGALAEDLHLVRHGEARVGYRLDGVVRGVEERAARQDYNGEIIVQYLAYAQRPQYDVYSEDEIL
jgi:hypothetical protein